jgi:hypothetical protein
MHHSGVTLIDRGFMWPAGNERPTLRLNSGYKYGIDWSNYSMVTLDAMSEKSEPATINLSITYEYVLKNSEMGRQYKPVTMKWVQMMFVQPQPGQKSYKSLWSLTSDVSGKLLYTMGEFSHFSCSSNDDVMIQVLMYMQSKTGHMHDGGTNLQLYINDKVVCNSIMFYDGGAKGLIKAHDWVSTKGVAAQAGKNETFGGAHIAAPGVCTNFGTIKKGDIIRIEAFYDFNKFDTMMHDGKPESLMGNCRVWIGPDGVS